MEQARIRSEQYRSTPQGKQKNRAQKRRYLPTIRHIDSVIKDVTDEAEVIPLEEISRRIYKLKKVKFKPRTIETRLEYYKEHFGLSPLEKIDNENYRLNKTFYKSPKRKY